jgi:hypothetical protein
MPVAFASLSTLDFQQKRDLLQLLSALVDAARREASRRYDSSDHKGKLAAVTDTIGLENLYYQISDRRTALERDHLISVEDLVDPVLQYCQGRGE